MAIRTIQSPGIEITERDLSQYTTGPVGTAVLVTGFAAKGRDYEPILLTSRSAWLQQFGEPTNEAEKYFFNASMEVINQGGKLYACKLPYKNEALNKFTVKTYTVNVSQIQTLSTVAEYVSETPPGHYLTDILAGNYTRFGYDQPDEEYLKYLYAAKDTQKAFEKFSEAVDKFTVAIPYAYAYDDWMGSINIPDCSQDNWMYTPVQFIVDKLKALFDGNSKFYRWGGPDAPSGYVGFDEWRREQSPELPEINLSALKFNGSMNEDDKLNRFADLIEKALGGDPTTRTFKVACDPSTGVNLQGIEEEYGETFLSSDIYRFYRDNEIVFKALNQIDFQSDADMFANLKPYFYCDNDVGFNLGAYYRAIKLYYRTKDYYDEFNNTDVVGIWNNVVGLDDYLDIKKPSLSRIFDKPIYMIERIPIPTAFVDISSDPSLDNIKWVDSPEANAELKTRLITRLSGDLVTPLDSLKDAFDKLFKEADFDALIEEANNGVYNNSDFAKVAIQNYLDNTIIDNADIKRDLRNALNLNVFYNKYDKDGLTSTSDDMSTVFELYNGPDSSSPELSSVQAVIDSAANKLNYSELLDFSVKFDKDLYNQLSVCALSSELSDSLLDSLNALLSDNIVSTLAYSEIKKADPSVKAYLPIDSLTSDVKLEDLETIDGYATGETPVRPNTFVIVDKTRGTLGKAYSKKADGTQKEIVGILPIVTTAANALYAQSLLDTGDSGITKYNAVLSAATLADEKMVGPQFIDPGDAAIPFYSDNAGDYTVSQIAADSFPNIFFKADGQLDRQNLKKIGVVIFKCFLDPGEGNKVNYDLVEAFAGELDKDAIDPNTGAGVFIDDIVNNQSEYIEFYSNCFNQTATKKKYSELDLLIVRPQKAGILGFYDYMVEKKISLTDSIMKALPLVWEKNEDINEKQIDIVCDAGVSNIAQFIKSCFNGRAGEYDPASEVATLFKLRSKEDTKTYRAVLDMYDNFCKNIRKDCMFVADGPRPFCLTGNKKIVRPSKPSNTIDASILPLLKYITGINTNYGAGYCDWFQKADEFTGDYFWCPPSIQATGVYLNTDINFDYWEAPAGLNRGVVSALDVAFNPTQRQADEIYPKCWNYARNYPNDGIVLEGQRTFQTKESSLDRVAARRALLRFERIVYELARYFVYEVNNAYNRQRFYDAVDGIFKEIKGQGGMYDYHIVCDESLNTDEVIERNEFRCKIGLKLNKYMEFILIEFNLLKRSASWTEML